MAGHPGKMLAERMPAAELTHHLAQEVTQWQQRPLDAMYPILYFNALRLKIRDDGTVRNKALYPAPGTYVPMAERRYRDDG